MKKISLILVVLVSLSLTSLMIFTKKTSLEKKTPFKVIRVNGKILFVKTQSQMKRGDVYVNGTPLKFLTNTAKAAIINPQKGRYVLQSNTKGKVKVLPATSNVTSRAGALINQIDLQNHFSGKYLILDKDIITIGSEAFPMDDKHFFYLKYYYNDEEIAKVIPHESNKIILSKTEIFKVDGQPIPVEEKEMTLYYRNDVDKKSYKINTFTPVFPDLGELKLEIKMMLDELREEKTDEDKISEITSYLNEFYGEPQKESLYKWLEKEFNINVEKDLNFK
jgi:hypothetical protein